MKAYGKRMEAFGKRMGSVWEAYGKRMGSSVCERMGALGSV